MLLRRLFSTTRIIFFRKEELYQIKKENVTKSLYTPPDIPEDIIPQIEYTINGLTLEERRKRVENAPNPKDDTILSHLDICPDWNSVIPKEHLNTGVLLPDNITNVIIQVIDLNLYYNNPLNYILHGYFPPLAFKNPHIKFNMERNSTIEKNQIIVKYRDEITINADVDSVDEILNSLQTTFGIDQFNTPVPSSSIF